MKLINAAVITGDIIHSTKLTSLQRRRLQSKLLQFSDLVKTAYPDFKIEQFRGDSIQATLTKKRPATLRIALLLQCYLIKNGFQVRQAIGIGNISFSSRRIVTSDGTAFQISGKLVDHLKKKNECIGISAENELFKNEWEVHSISLSYLLGKISKNQAEAVYLQLLNSTQETIAKKLKISQPSVYQRLHAAGWPVMQSILNRFENIVSSL